MVIGMWLDHFVFMLTCTAHNPPHVQHPGTYYNKFNSLATGKGGKGLGTVSHKIMVLHVLMISCQYVDQYISLAMSLT